MEHAACLFGSALGINNSASGEGKGGGVEEA